MRLNYDLLTQIFEEVKSYFVPNKEYSKKIEEISKKILEKIKKYREAIVGGSVGKNTYVKGDVDFDIFVFFDKDEINESSNILEEILKNEFKDSKIVRLHGSRDYFKLIYEGYEVEFIPILKIKDVKEAQTTTDFSPLHVKYIKSKIDEYGNKVREFIILLKKLFKSIGIYGAESYIQGFSGYSVELLGIYYKSFMKFFEDVEYNYKPKVTIDIEKYYRNFKEIVYSLGQDRIKGPIIIIDPVNPTRNASAAVSYNSFAKLVFWIRYLLRKPSKEIFFKKETIEDVKRRSEVRGNKLFIKKYPLHLNKDVFLSKIVSNLRKGVNSLKNYGISVYDYGIVVEKPYVYTYIELWKGNVYRHLGPIAWVEAYHFDNFLEKLRSKNVVYGPYILNTNVCIDLKIDEEKLVNENVFSRIYNSVKKYLEDKDRLYLNFF